MRINIGIDPPLDQTSRKKYTFYLWIGLPLHQRLEMN